MEKSNKFVGNVLKAMGFESLNPMQQEMYKKYKAGNDIILLSPTGTGKTLAFLLPMAEQLVREAKMVQTLIITPSRELALQIERVFRSMQTGFRVVCCYGGHDIKKEINALSVTPDVVVGTPGRILDHFRSGNINPADFTTLILDEFDKALELGFTEEMSDIISQLSSVKKKVLTSATEGTEIPEYTALLKPTTISFLESNNVSKRLTLRQVKSPVADKLETLYKLICELGEGSKLVFCNYRDSASRVSQYLAKHGVPNTNFHGGLEQSEREKALGRFRSGSTNVLVSTDLAARGLDIPEISHIIHYHLPINEEAFVHRNGRTARMNAEGAAYLILGPDEYLPEYVKQDPEHFSMSDETPAPAVAKWETLYIGKGKKDKISKGDIAGFLMQKGKVAKEDIGIIEVLDKQSFVAIKREVITTVLKNIENEKIKNMKTRIEIAR